LDSLGAFTLRCLSKIAHSETGRGYAADYETSWWG
jgi:hypothetical protein